MNSTHMIMIKLRRKISNSVKNWRVTGIMYISDTKDLEIRDKLKDTFNLEMKEMLKRLHLKFYMISFTTTLNSLLVNQVHHYSMDN